MRVLIYLERKAWWKVCFVCI